MKVREIMRPARWTVTPESTLGRGERIMARRRIHYLLVVDAGALVGLLSERDILDVRADGQSDNTWRRMPVRSAMQDVLPTASPDDSVESAIERLADSPVDVLPVVEQGFLIGQITAIDLFEAERVPAEPPPAPLTAADVMSEPAVAVGPGESLLEAARLMAEHQVRHLPVVEGGGVIGMLSDRDIRTVAGDPVRFAESRNDEGARMVSVRDAMATTVVTVRDDRPLTEVADKLADERFGALPVVDGDGHLIGIVSYVDALRALAA
jgi:acetoin utilization protein AcuB